jgi:hypothetical protein
MKISIIDYIGFIARGSDWTQFGIEIGCEDNDLINPTRWQITVNPYPWKDTSRYNEIVKLFGNSQWVVKCGWISVGMMYRELFGLYKACRRVDEMKVFL